MEKARYPMCKMREPLGFEQGGETMKLVKLHLEGGDPVYVNPAHIILVCEEQGGGTVVHVRDFGLMAVEETPEQVCEACEVN